MRKGKKRIVLLLILVVGISIGYAALANTIKINGTSVVKGANWNIYWDNVNVDSGSVSGANVITTPTTTGTTTTEVEFSVVLPEPGDYYEFTIDAVNAGSIDAMIEDNGVQNKVYSDSGYTQEATLPDVVRYTVTNLDGSAIESGHVLPKKEESTPTRETYKVRVEYRNDEEIDASDLDKDNDKTYYFKFAVTYVQSSSSEESDEPVVGDYVCKKAETFHTEECIRTSNGCFAAGYTADGAKGTSTITYGHTNGTSLVNGQSGGYALDCDLNGNGVVDTDSNGMSTERFYYVSDLYTGTENGVDKFDNKYAVLIYYKNITTVGIRYYYENNKTQNWHGPVTLLSSLPTRSDWTNEKIVLKSTSRTIVNELGDPTTKSGANQIENPFEYTGKVGRLLTVQELIKGCNMASATSKTGDLEVCEYILEDSSYEKNYECTENQGNCYYWLENPRAGGATSVWTVSGMSRQIENYTATSVYYGVRPVIEVPKSYISLK